MSTTIPLGRQEVDMSVYAKVAVYETLRQPNVIRMHPGGLGRFGMGRKSGLTTRVSDDGTLQIDISVVVRYGADLRELGPAIQDAVLNGIRRLSDQPVGQINVYVADIEFAPLESELGREEPEA